jgi:hypothetical protein
MHEEIFALAADSLVLQVAIDVNGKKAVGMVDDQ